MASHIDDGMGLVLPCVEWADDSFQTTWDRSVCTIRAALHTYAPWELCFSFNGGKDCTVLFHVLVAAAHAADTAASKPAGWHLSMIRFVYFETEKDFPEVQAFMRAEMARFGLRLETRPAFPAGLSQLLEHTAVRAVLLGTRSSDPDGRTVQEFSPCSPGWPAAMRVNPLLHWTYEHVWTFLRKANIPYCHLYDRGYTSLGDTDNSVPNPALQIRDPASAEVSLELVCSKLPAQVRISHEHALDLNAGAGTVTLHQHSDGSWYAPAWCLSSGERERDGRLTKPARRARAKPAERQSSCSAPSAELAAPARAEELLSVLLVGDELLCGRVLDNNAAVIACAATAAGFTVPCITILPDSMPAVARAIAAAKCTSAFVVLAGGMGATHDDISMHAVAHGLGVAMRQHAQMLAFLQRWAAARGHVMTEAYIRQAELPAGAELHWPESDVGREKYPCVIVQNVLLLPGLPSIVSQKISEVMPLLQSRSRAGSVSQWQHAAELHIQLQEEVLEPVLSQHATRMAGKDIALGSYPVDNLYFAQQQGTRSSPAASPGDIALDDRPWVRVEVHGVDAAAVTAAMAQLHDSLRACFSGAAVFGPTPAARCNRAVRS